MTLKKSLNLGIDMIILVIILKMNLVVPMTRKALFILNKKNEGPPRWLLEGPASGCLGYDSKISCYGSLE